MPQGPEQAGDVGSGQCLAIAGSCLCRDSPSSALPQGAAEHPKAPLLTARPACCPLLLSPHSSTHWTLLLQGNAFLSLPLDADRLAG